jgi:hypothetical protein
LLIADFQLLIESLRNFNQQSAINNQKLLELDPPDNIGSRRQIALEVGD